MPEFNIIAEYIPSSNLTAQFIPVNFNVPPVLTSKTITANGLYEASADNATGYSSVTVAVPDRPTHNGELNVTPTTEAQTIDVPSYLDGYGPVNVAAVTSAIDSNIKPENIKQGATILGVQGSVIELNGETVNITPTTTEQVIEPTSPKNAITRATVSPVTSSIDPNIQPSNIKEGVSILGVDGSVVESNETTLNVTPTTSAQTLSPTSPYTGFDEVNVSAVTSSIDANIQPENIRENVTILGTTGTAHVPVSYREFEYSSWNNQLRNSTQVSQIADLLGAKDLGHGVFCFAYSGDRNLTGKLDLSGLTKITGWFACYMAFDYCTNITSVDMSGVREISGSTSCARMFEYCSGITTVDLSSLIGIYGNIDSDSYNNTCNKMFYACSNLVSVDLSSLQVMNGSSACRRMFAYCSKLENISMPSLTSISRTEFSSCTEMFEGCVGLKTVDMRNLTEVGNSGLYYGFEDCTGLTSVNFASLATVGQSSFNRAFYNCQSLASISFPSLTSVSSDAFEYCFYGCSSLVSVSITGLQTISGSDGFRNAFSNLTSLTTVDMRALTTVSGQNACTEMFKGCSGITSVNLSSLTTLSGYYGLSYMFQNCTSLTSISLPSLTTISGQYAMSNCFNGCTSLTTANLSGLSTITGTGGLNYCFTGCTGLTTVNMQSLTTCGYTGLAACFSGCTSLTSIDLSSLTILGNSFAMNSCFQDCTSLTSVTFTSLASINSSQVMINCFSGCTSLTEVFFPSLALYTSYNNQFNNMLVGCDGVTVHFPANVESRISTWTSTRNGFGGTNTTVLYDLPSTFLLTGADTLQYSRNPKHDTATALAWKVGAYNTTDFSPAFYTNGTTDPQVGDTIYSDAACTTAVTTISTIA